MRAVIQKVYSASVSVNNSVVSRIDKGLLVLLGIHIGDTEKERDYIIKKIINLRVFEDEAHKMNKSVSQVSGAILVVSQFTLYGDCRKGNRPSFIEAMPPERAKQFYDDFMANLRVQYALVEEGIFGACMQVELVNDGPVTLVLDTI